MGTNTVQAPDRFLPAIMTGLAAKLAIKKGATNPAVAQRVPALGAEADRLFLRRPERILRPDREAVHVGAIEARDIDIGADVSGDHAAQRFVEGHAFDPDWRPLDHRVPASLRFVAIDDVEELSLLHLDLASSNA